MNRNLVLALVAGACITCAVCHSALAVAVAGPDSFGYIAESATYNLRDVSATGFNVGLDASDDATALAPIGFSFPFYGANYAQVEISTNGFIAFTSTGNSFCCSGVAIPSAGGADNFIAGWWEDLDPSEGGTIRYQTLGSVGDREFVVGYYQVRDNDDPLNSINTMELILHETGEIELQYAQIQFEDVDNKVVGIENIDGTDGLELLFMPSSAPFPNGHIVYQNQGFLIRRIPEPATCLLATTLLTGLALQQRRRIRKIAHRPAVSS